MMLRECFLYSAAGMFNSAQAKMTEREPLVNKKGKTNSGIRQEGITWRVGAQSQRTYMYTHTLIYNKEQQGRSLCTVAVPESHTSKLEGSLGI